MAGGVEIQVDVRGMKEFRNLILRMSRKIENRRDLHVRWAILAYNWVQRNFQTEGGNVGGWAQLSPNTLAGRRKGSGRILQDTGQLKGSFVPSWTNEYAAVGSPMQIARYHEEGTGTHGPKGAPYAIEPLKPGGWLRFKMATESGVRTKVLKSGKTLSLPFAKGGFVFAKKVMHPGVQKRRMLPTQNDTILVRDVMKAGLEYLKVQEGLGNTNG